MAARVTFSGHLTGSIPISQWVRPTNLFHLTPGPNASFAFQHDANFITDTGETLTIFDNGSSGIAGRPLPTNATESRGIQLHLNFSTMTATLDQQYLSPTHFLSTSQGNVQMLSNGNAFLGWGGQWYGEACLMYFANSTNS